MTEQEKPLLLKDLCTRLPYGVKCYIEFNDGKVFNERTLVPVMIQDLKGHSFLSFKPYLRLMSSMTDEEQKELEKIIDGILGYKARNYFHSEDDYNWDTLYEAIDWLNAHHFDYRGLIEKNLALKAPDGMYK